MTVELTVSLSSESSAGSFSFPFSLMPQQQIDIR